MEDFGGTTIPSGPSPTALADAKYQAWKDGGMVIAGLTNPNSLNPAARNSYSVASFANDLERQVAEIDPNYFNATPIYANGGFEGGGILVGFNQADRSASALQKIVDASNAKKAQEAAQAQEAARSRGVAAAITPEMIQGAKDWYGRNIAQSFGVIPWSQVGGDNYQGLKVNGEINSGVNAYQSTLCDMAGGAPTGQVGADKAEFGAFNAATLAAMKAEYLKDPQAYIDKEWKRNVKTLSVGRDGNQQYEYDPGTGKVVKTWNHNTDESYLAVPLLALAGGLAATAISVGGWSAGAGAGVGEGAAAAGASAGEGAAAGGVAAGTQAGTPAAGSFFDTLKTIYKTGSNALGVISKLKPLSGSGAPQTQQPQAPQDSPVPPNLYTNMRFNFNGAGAGQAIRNGVR